MATTAQILIEIAKSVEPEGGYFGYFDLVDAWVDGLVGAFRATR